MNPLRKEIIPDLPDAVREAEPRHAPEALGYDEPLDPEEVKRIQKKADKILKKDKWETIDGHDIKR